MKFILFNILLEYIIDTNAFHYDISCMYFDHIPMVLLPLLRSHESPCSSYQAPMSFWDPAAFSDC